MANALQRLGWWIALCLSRGNDAPLSKNDVALLVEEMGESSFAGGTFVFRQGEPAAKVHVVRSGTIELSRQVNGRQVTVQILRPGDVFGDVPAFLGEPEVFDAKAIDDCAILSLDTESLFKLLQTRPLIARRWFVSLAERTAGLQDRLTDLLAGGIDAQLASILLREADESSRIRVTQAALASMLGVQRSSVQRVLKRLELAQLITTRYRSIEVIDHAGLLLLLEEPDSSKSV